MPESSLRLITNAIARLLSSLGPSEPKIEKLWAAEVEDRIDALERGDLRTVSAEEFFRPPK